MGYSTSRSPNEHVTYMLRSPDKRPRSGVNAVSLRGTTVFAAGRDGTVRVWDSTKPSAPVSALAEHVDWVNDILALRGGERVVSASSDSSLKVWNPSSPRESLATLRSHTDYVKALAPLANGAVASAGLDGRVLMWDIEAGCVSGECGDWIGNSDGSGTGCATSNGVGSGTPGGQGSVSTGTSDGSGANGASAYRPSIYCLASSPEAYGSVIVSGSTDRSIRVYDARSGENVVRLRGHADAVRSLTLKVDGTLLLSGSSDATVRLWDLRQQRCVRTYESHPSDSVWALDAPRSFESFVSGGRDGTVWHTSLDGDCASLVVAVADPDARSNMVLDVALIPDQARVWVSTTGSTVRLWSVPPVDAPGSELGMQETIARASTELPPVDAQGSNGVRQNPLPAQSDPHLPNGDSCSVANGLPVRQIGNGSLSTLGPDDARAAAEADAVVRHTFGGTRGPLIELRGMPAIVAYKVMNNRRFVMTCDAANEVCLWDVTCASFVRSLGRLPENVDLEKFAEQHDEIVCVPAWFKVDIRLGSLAIRLSRNTIAEAEVYAVDADMNVDNEDLKLNIGEHVLRGLFSVWKERTLARAKSEGWSGNAIGGDGAASAPASSDPAAPGAGRQQAPGGTSLPPYVFPSETQVVISDESPLPRMIRSVGDFSGLEEESSALPLWVIDIVRDGKSLARETAPRIGFTVYPGEGCGLPELSNANLTAAQTVRIRKVAGYVSRELNAVRDSSVLRELVQESHLDILCNGKVIPPKMSLATAKKFMWQPESSGDLQLTFQLRSGYDPRGRR